MDPSPVPGPSSLNLFPSFSDDEDFNPQFCIICQESNKLPLTSEKTGRETLKRAASIRNDAVSKRIKILVGDCDDADDNAKFVYHNTNKCYKSYTHSCKLEAIEEKIEQCGEPMICETESQSLEGKDFTKSLRRSIVPCAPQAAKRILKHWPALFLQKSHTRKFVINSDSVSMRVQ